MLQECPKRCHGGALQSGPRELPKEPPQDTPEGPRETRFDAPGEVTEAPLEEHPEGPKIDPKETLFGDP